MNEINYEEEQCLVQGY